MNSGSSGQWRAQRTDDGSWTLLSPEHGEACHSLAGAWTQARERYASVLGELPAAISASKTVRLLDIGTGLGLNLAAALEACEALGLTLDATSLEIDPSVLLTAIELFRREKPCAESHGHVLDAIEFELATGGSDGPRAGCAIAGSQSHHLQLVLGDARSTLVELPPTRRFDAVFLDPFSPRIDPCLWDQAFLAEVARRMGPGARLCTYTSSLRVRAALSRAGLAVGLGPRVGRKGSGTLASRGGDVPVLDARTGRKLARAVSRALPPH